MCCHVDENFLEELKRTMPSTFIAYKVLKIGSGEIFFGGQLQARYPILLSPFSSWYRWTPGKNHYGQGSFSNANDKKRFAEGIAGIHVFLTKSEAQQQKEWFISKVAIPSRKWVIVPVECKIEDIKVAGPDDEGRLTATFTQVQLKPEDYEKGIRE